MPNEPTITDAQRAEWATWMESWRNLATTDGLEGSAATVLAVNERLGWLEAERARLVEENRRLQEEQQRSEPALRLAEASYAWDRACREADPHDDMATYLAKMKPFEVAYRTAFEAYHAALTSPEAGRKESGRE